jgi:oxygen-independent coproporphyrinogen-3 oxidase
LSKCGYCDFYSVALGPETTIDHDGYAEQILRELDRRSSEILSHRLTSIFVGGGTPSLWDTRALARVLRGVLGRFGARARDVEITVECNPSSFTASLVGGLLEAEVNRVSLGIQSLDESSLAFLGRRHDTERALSALELALSSGFRSVSADLLFGLPQQTTAQEVEQVRRVASLAPAHLSVYALTIEEGTHFGQLKRAGKLPLAVDERVAEAFLAIDAALETEGFEHYEISNYARPGHRSLHNQQYWWGVPYLGLGAAAWGTLSLDGRLLRYRNPANIGRYLGLDFNRGGPAPFALAPQGTLEQLETVDASMRVAERLLLGLRLREGVDLDVLAQETGVELLTTARRRALERQLQRGNLVREGSRIAIPPRAWLLADSTIADIA